MSELIPARDTSVSSPRARDDRPSNYPEHDKLAAISDKSQVIGEFLDWVADEKKIIRARWLEKETNWVEGDEGFGTRYHEEHDAVGRYETIREHLAQDTTSVQDLLAEFFNIDRDIIETEKRQMLDEMRVANEAHDAGSDA